MGYRRCSAAFSCYKLQYITQNASVYNVPHPFCPIRNSLFMCITTLSYNVVVSAAPCNKKLWDD